jgi:hypothetical protein
MNRFASFRNRYVTERHSTATLKLEQCGWLICLQIRHLNISSGYQFALALAEGVAIKKYCCPMVVKMFSGRRSPKAM